jgi:hypothetical protein
MVPSASGLVFMFCAPGLIFDGPEGAGFGFLVLRCRVRQVPFSCFALRDSFSAKTRVLGPVLMFCAPGVVSHGTEGVGSRFEVLRSRIRYWRYHGHRVP